MKAALLAAALLAMLAGCAALDRVRDHVLSAAAAQLDDYCDSPEELRAVLRAALNERMRRHDVTVLCAPRP